MILRIWIGLSVSLILGPHLFAQSDLLSRPLQLSQQKGTVLELLSTFSSESGIVLAYSSDLLQTDREVVFSGNEQTAADYLAAILKDQPVQIKQKKGKILLIPLKKASQPKRYTLSGYVRETGSKEVLPLASIVIPHLALGTHSNGSGFFSLSVPEGSYRIRTSYVGHQASWAEVDLRRDRFLLLELEPDFALEEVEILAEEQQASVDKISTQRILPDQLEALPMLLGQKDVLKQLQLLPGVQSMNEGISGLVVRGGNPDQNLMMLDDVPIYNPNHSLGLFSVFYGDAIQSSRIMKGAFPADVGGRLSSVVDVRMKDGNKEQYHGDITTGLLLSTIRLEGPIRKKKGKTSFHLSARRTLIDLLTNDIQVSLRENQNFPFSVNYFFQDINFKLNHRFSPNTQLTLSTYFGKDQFQWERYGTDQMGNLREQPDVNTFLNWGNQLFSAKLNQVLGAKWFLNLTFHVSNYDYLYFNFAQNPLRPPDTDSLIFFSNAYFSQTNIRNIGIKSSVDFYPNPQHHLKMGLGYIDHSYSPFVQFFIEEDSLIDSRPPRIPEDKSFAQEYFGYLQDHWKISPNLSLRAGVRTTAFLVDQADYLEVQPRVSLGWQFHSKQSLGLSFSRMIQFSHLLTTPGIGLPSDLWVPSTASIRPQQANHFNLSYRYRPNKDLSILVEAYYKQLNRILDYQQDLTFQTRDPNENWEDLVTVGKGWGYGLEAQIEKSTGKTTGWLAYALGWSKRQFLGINDGKPFPFRFDRRHSLTLSMLYRPKPKREFGLVWIFATGQAVTLGQQRYPSLNSPIPIIPLGPRNGYRTPPYHRLDLSMSFHKQKKRGIRSWIFGIYNSYARQNPFFLSFSPDFSGNLQLYQQSLLPLIPYITFRFRF